MPEVTQKEWVEFIQTQPNTHLLQSAQWGELKAAFGWDVVRIIEGDTGAQIMFRPLPLGYSLAYIPRGPVGPSWDNLWPALDRLSQKKRSVFLKIEPDLWMDDPSTPNDPPPGYISSPHSIQPPRTIVLQIDTPEKQILGQMKQKTRYNISLAGRKEVEVASSEDVNTFHKMTEQTGERSGFGVHSRAYYQKAYDLFRPEGMCELFFARYKETILAGLMVFAGRSRAYYFYGASTEKERNRMPTYLLQWEAIRWARRRGCTEYDLWGVPDVDLERLEAEFTERKEGLWGVYRFKRGFGGELKRSVGPWDRVYHPMLYKLYHWMSGRRTA